MDDEEKKDQTEVDAVIQQKVEEILAEAEMSFTPMQSVAEAIFRLTQYLADFE